MAVIKCERARGYPKTKVRLEGRGTQAQIKTTHRDRYEIECDDETDIGLTILSQTGFNITDPFPEVNGFADPRLVEMDLDRDEKARLKWYLDLAYEEIDEDTQNNQDTPPDQLEPEWNWTFETVDKVITNDVDTGDPIETTAGEAIEYVGPIVIPVLRVERFKASFDPNEILNYANHRNSATFWGADPGTVILAGIEDHKDTKVLYNNQYYRKVSYVLKFLLPFIPNVQEGWTDLIINRGTYYIDSNQNKIHFKAGGSETTGNLDETGGKLDDNANYVVFVRANKFPEADLNDLDLGPFE